MSVFFSVFACSASAPDRLVGVASAFASAEEYACAANLDNRFDYRVCIATDEDIDAAVTGEVASI